MAYLGGHLAMHGPFWQKKITFGHRKKCDSPASLIIYVHKIATRFIFDYLCSLYWLYSKYSANEFYTAFYEESHHVGKSRVEINVE